MKYKSVFSLVFVFLSIFCISIGLIKYLSNTIFTFNAQKTEGLFKEIVTDKLNNNKLAFLKIEFEIDNKIYSINSSIRYLKNKLPFNLNDKIEVLYDKNNPSKAKLNSFKDLHTGTLVLVMFSLVFFILSFIFDKNIDKYLKEV